MCVDQLRGFEWQVSGIAADPPSGSVNVSNARPVQAMASTAPASSGNSTLVINLASGDPSQHPFLTVPQAA